VRRDAKASSAGSISGQGASLGSFLRGAFAIRGAFGGADGSGAPLRGVSARFLTLFTGALLGLLAFGVSFAAAAAPTVTIDPNPTLGYTTAQVSGTVDTHGEGGAQVYAEYATSEAGLFTYVSIATIPAGTSGVTPVSGEITGLAAGTEYFFRLDAENSSNGETYSPTPYPSASTKAVVVSPSVSIDPVGAFTATTANFSGHVNPNAPEPAPANPDVEAGFAVHWHFRCTPECPGLNGTVAADDTAHAVAAEATGLLPGTNYQVTLVGENAGGAATRQSAGPVSFTTPAVAPVINAATIASVGGTAASIGAKIVPGGAPTAYRVEYGPTTAYGQSTPESEPIGADNTEHVIATTLEGLAPETTYHLRFVATNSVDATNGPDLTITTFAAGIPLSGLPDGRSYEQVSSTDKGGANISGQQRGTLASPDGNAVVFSTVPTLPGSEGAQDYGTYQATRSDSAWGTLGLLPPASIGREGRVVGVDQDLNMSYVRTFNPETGVLAFYQRDNTTRQLTQIASGQATFADSTPNGSAMLFESTRELTPGSSPGTENVYLWNAADRTLHLADAMNDGEEPAEGAYAGPYLGAGTYYAAAEALSADGGDVLFTAIDDHQLYLRRNVLAPQSALNGQEECTEPEKACTVQISRSQASIPDPNGVKPTTLWKVGNAGAPVAFFTSAGKLTDDATTGPADESKDLYRYDAESEELTDLVPDASDPEGADVVGVLGVSEDGLRAYFVANGVLGDGAAEGATPGNCTEAAQTSSGECNLYLWSKAGGIAFIGRLDAEGELKEEADSANWVRGLELQIDNTARVSRDGASLVFRSQHPQTQAPTGGVPQFYRYDAAEDSVQCLTCDASGAEQPGIPTLYSYSGSVGSAFGSLEPTRNLSADGSRFIFESSARLVAADVNGIGGCPRVLVLSSPSIPSCQDVYEWEAKGTGSCESSDQNGGCLFLLSSGTSSEPSFFDAADENGENAFIFTSQQLVGQDHDQLVDIYDARVGGGLPGQNQPPPLRCTSPEACKAAGAGPPAEASPGSASFNGAPEKPQKKPPRKRKAKCKQGFKSAKRHGKSVCVKKGGSKHHQKRARHNSGGAK
jgi:hypothetical protein